MEENTTAMVPDAGEQIGSERDGELIGYDWGREAPAAPEVTEADWNADIPGDDSDAVSGESYRLKHLGREFDVSRDEIITLAQKGVDYDRIRSRADTLAENLRQRDAEGSGPITPYQRRDRETREFVAAYGDVKPGEIPQEVWREVADGKSLLMAYQSYENRMLRSQIEAGRRENANRRKSTGARPTLGAAIERGELEADWYRD